MSEPYICSLYGCAPTPLASYLKALGVLRLLASEANNVKGEAADSAARGWWDGEHFHLKTRLDRDALLRFFLDDYAPSPIVAPWNGGSGFYHREGKTGEKNPETGKMIKTGVRDAPTRATERIDSIIRSNDPRFAQISQAIATARRVIDEFGFKEAPDPKTGRKAAFIDRYRSVAGEGATEWVDAALSVTGEQFDPAALLGSGGNDGNLDFSTAFQAALLTILDPKESSIAALECALFDRAIACAWSAGVSQLAPGNIGAANSSNGFFGADRGDPWSVVLMFEGTVAFAGASTRRDAANRPRGSFPFTVSQMASGSGSVAGDDDASSRADELWLPLWTRPASFMELRALLCEGRAHLGRREARDGLTFARAVSALGVSRGVDEFVRLGFEARYGNMFITVPLGRFRTPKRQRDDPIADLDAGGWLGRIHRFSREKNAPARARIAVRRLDDALFDTAREGPNRHVLQGALVALGSLVSWLTTSREGREKVMPPPLLGRRWVYDADDNSPEFRIAAALASMGWPENARENAKGQARDEIAADASDGAEDEPAVSAEMLDSADPSQKQEPDTRRKSAPLMAAHLAPVEEETIVRRRRRWADNDPPSVVWGIGSLVQNMIAVLERRLIEKEIRGLRDKPLDGASPARLADVVAFSEGAPAFDDARCAALLAGLVWARPTHLDMRRDDAPVPFAYAALKPLFTPDNDLRRGPNWNADARQFLSTSGTLPIPPGLVGRLRRGDHGALESAVRNALGRACASGISSPFSLRIAASTRLGAGVDPVRLAAALLIPIDERSLTTLMKRAYPEDSREEETDNAA